MLENIKYYPQSYVMSDELKLFFTAVTNDAQLQDALYLTPRIADVATIANKMGFNVKAREILKAQAGRVLAIIAENSDDVERLVSGRIPETGAQWGRGGGGFLDRAGFWLIELFVAPAGNIDIEVQINNFLDRINQDSDLKKKLISAKTFNDVALLATENDLSITSVDFLFHQAKKIIALSEAEAEILAAS